MATLDQTIDIQLTTPNPDFEPEEEWKISLRQQIEDTLKPEAEKLKRELTEKLKDLSPSEASKAQADYDNTMAEIRRTANEQYRQLLARERQERRWAAGERVDERWAEVLMKEQQALLDNYKNAMGRKVARSEGHSQPPPSLDHPPASRMETLDQTIDIQPTTPNPDFEPEEEWKTGLRQRIEDSFKPAAEKLERELNERLKDLSPPEASKAQADYDNTMAEVRRTANEQYRQLLARERQERRWAAGEKIDEKWTEILMKEQQAFLEKHKNGDMGKANQLPKQLPGVVIDLGRPIQLPPPSPSSRSTWMRWTPPSNENRTLTHASGRSMESVEPRRDTNASVSITSSALPEASPVLSHPATIPGTRRPSNILPEPVPEDSPPTRLSREPRPYSSTGSWSQSNGRVWSSTRPPWEIWKPSPNESTSSRTSARGTGGTTKPRRDTSFSTISSVPSRASPTPSHPPTIPGMRGPLVVPKDPPSSRPPPEGREPRPYSSAGNSSGRSNDRDRSRAPPRPTPEIWKLSSNENTTSRSLAHATGEITKPRRDFSASIGNTSSFPATIPQDTSLGADMDKDDEKRWSDIFQARQKARKDSAGAGGRITVVQPPPDLKRDDSDDDRKQRFIAEFSRQFSNAKQMEEVMEQRAEAHKEAELGAREAEAKTREEELKRREEEAVEEARRKLKELRKEDELRRSFTNEPHQPSRLQRTPSPITLASGSSSTTPTPDTSSDLSALADPKSSACRRLISHTFSPHETVSLIQVIFTSKAEINIIRDLRGDDAQAFIDAVHGVRLRFILSFLKHLLIGTFASDLPLSTYQALDLPDLLPWHRKKCLSVLCKICGRQALLPKSLRVPLCYNRSDNPLYRGGYADVWKGEHRGRHVAVKVLRVYSMGDSDKITSVRFSACSKACVDWLTELTPVEVLQGGRDMESS